MIHSDFLIDLSILYSFSFTLNSNNMILYNTSNQCFMDLISDIIEIKLMPFNYFSSYIIVTP